MRLTRLHDARAGTIVEDGEAVVRTAGPAGPPSGTVKRAAGHGPPVINTMLAATAIEHDLYLVTRNV